MYSSEVSDPAAVIAAVDRLGAAFGDLAASSLNALSAAQALDLLARLQRLRCAQPALEHRLLHQLTSQTSPAELGARTWSKVLRERLSLSAGEAGRRLEEAADLGPRRALNGEPLEPALPHLAKRQAAGELNAEHVAVIRRFLHDLPAAVDYQTRRLCEETLATLAAGQTPGALRKAADRLAALVNPDGDFTDEDRARRRYLLIGRQGPDGLSRIEGLLDPQSRAALEAVLAKLAAPGMCNPDDITPRVDEHPTDDAAGDTPDPTITNTPDSAPPHPDVPAADDPAARDTRTQGQRNHDALAAAARAVLASGRLGQLKGLPATIIVRTTLQELQSAAGHAETAGGTLLPMRDLIRLAAHAYHYLAIFDTHTDLPLYLGRTRRLASPGQRIVLHARDIGCTYPDCTVPGYGCDVHHAHRDWAGGGNTNIDEEVLACGPHNRLVTDGGWTTRIRPDGRVEWIPPPHLDHGQSRVNDYHHPDRLLRDAATEG